MLAVGKSANKYLHRFSNYDRIGPLSKSVTGDFKMKFITILLAGVLLATAQVYADLSAADFEKIESIVKESETRMKEYVSQEIAKVDTKISAMDKRLASEINAVDKQVARNFNLVLSLIALIAVAVGLPQLITAWQGRKSREQTEKNDALKQEVELLKQERFVRP